jgi:hypothetical protein
LDYIVHYYPQSGCCLRDCYDVFLQHANGEFLDEIRFINPTFSVKEKIIRGLQYGYSAPLYKYQWNGFNLDTIEYIFFPDSTNGYHYIKSRHYLFSREKDKDKKGQIIKGIPDEYKNIPTGYN